MQYVHLIIVLISFTVGALPTALITRQTNTIIVFVPPTAPAIQCDGIKPSFPTRLSNASAMCTPISGSGGFCLAKFYDVVNHCLSSF